jgi:hypothetical protein
VVVIADGSKIGTVTSSVVGPADRIETLVTDPTAPDNEVRRLRRAGIDVVIARARSRTTDGPASVPAVAQAAAGGHS